MPETEKRTDHFGQTTIIPAIEESFTQEGSLRGRKKLKVTISPREYEAIIEMVKNLHACIDPDPGQEGDRSGILRILGFFS